MVFPAVVDPPAKYHWDAVWDAHGAMLQPPGPDTAWSATTPPPTNTNDEAVLPPGSPTAGLTAALPRAGTATRRLTVDDDPPPGDGPTLVITPLTTSGVELVRKMVVDAAFPVPAAQKADDEYDPAGGTGTASKELGAAGAVGAGKADETIDTPTATTATATTACHCHRTGPAWLRRAR